MFRMLGIHLFYPWHRNPNSNDRDNPVGLGSHPWLPEKLLKGVELLKVNGGNFDRGLSNLALVPVDTAAG